MKNALMLVVLGLFTFSLTAQKSWQHYYDRLPAWPENLDTATLSAFSAKLHHLMDDLEMIEESALEETEPDFENMSAAEAMKMAQKYQQEMLSMDPDEMAARSEGIDQMMDDLDEARLLDARFRGSLEEFQKVLAIEKKKIREMYPCDIGMEDKNDRCESRAAALRELGEKMSSQYFKGKEAVVRKNADALEDHILKKSLPATRKQMVQQYEALAMPIPTFSSEEADMMKSLIRLRLECIDAMDKIARIRMKDNLLHAF
jgi:hypothetical protein